MSDIQLRLLITIGKVVDSHKCWDLVLTAGGKNNEFVILYKVDGEPMRASREFESIKEVRIILGGPCE